MARTQLAIDTGFYTQDEIEVGGQSCINLFPVNPKLNQGTSTRAALFRTPGTLLASTHVGGVGRGFERFLKSDTLYAVNGNKLYSKTSPTQTTEIGTISGSGRVSMANNGTTLVIIVPGGDGYFYTVASGLNLITDPVFIDFQAQQGGVTSVCLKDNRFLYTTDEEFFSGSVFSTSNGQGFDALDFEDAEVSSDKNVRGMVIKNELYIFGEETIELYQNIGGNAFPFQRIGGATISKGLAARFGILAYGNSFVFIGSGKEEKTSIWQGASATALNISTPAIDSVIQNYTKAQIATVTTWAYSEDGSYFIGFAFPNETFVYDQTASVMQGRPVWHERKTGATKWRVEDIVNMFGDNIVSDNQNTNIGLLNRDYLNEYGTAIARTFTGPYLNIKSETFTVNAVELKCSPGPGNLKGTTDDEPMIEMLISFNGANTWTSLGSKHLGRINEYTRRQIWRRLGRVPYNILFKWTTSAEISVDFYRIDIEFNGKLVQAREAQQGA